MTPPPSLSAAVHRTVGAERRQEAGEVGEQRRVAVKHEAGAGRAHPDLRIILYYIILYYIILYL